MPQPHRQPAPFVRPRLYLHRNAGQTASAETGLARKCKVRVRLPSPFQSNHTCPRTWTRRSMQALSGLYQIMPGLASDPHGLDNLLKRSPSKWIYLKDDKVSLSSRHDLQSLKFPETQIRVLYRQGQRLATIVLRTPSACVHCPRTSGYDTSLSELKVGT